MSYLSVDKTSVQNIQNSNFTPAQKCILFSILLNQSGRAFSVLNAKSLSEHLHFNLKMVQRHLKTLLEKNALKIVKLKNDSRIYYSFPGAYERMKKIKTYYAIKSADNSKNENVHQNLQEEYETKMADEEKCGF